MKILVTGADGMVGSNLVNKLSKKYEVIALDYLKDPTKLNFSGVEFINQDLSDFDLKFPEVDVIVHLAAITIERISENPKHEIINQAATLNVLQQAKIQKAKLIWASSCSVYGNGLNIREDSPYNPLSLYSVGKINDESFAKYYAYNYGVDITMLRYSNCYCDLTEIDNKVYPGKKGVVRIFLESIAKNKPVPLISGQIRDFTFIDDVIDATERLLFLHGFNIFNIATGVGTEIDQLPIIMGAILGRKIKVEMKKGREIDNIFKRSLNVEKVSQYWKAKWQLYEGIKEFIKRLRDKDESMFD
jgi:nucleoside-diphosphate-sugar epimerase|tara:strand:+ start:11620 stop:12525 length:906 start_codon:yes stop_codon:yes gene_type:complete